MFERYFFALILALTLSPLQAAEPLVNTEWILANLSSPDLVVLDLQPKATYERFHLPGAVNSDYSDWRRPNAKKTPQMLPTIDHLERLIGSFGIDNRTRVVLVVTGRSASEMAVATRVYWTFKALGHDAVSILDGGLIAYAESRSNPLERGNHQPTPKAFKANPRNDYLVTAVQVQEALQAEIRLVDNRSSAEYLGLLSGGGKERPGTIPGATNLPFDWLTINGGARFHPKENLKRIYTQAGVPLAGEQISFCHTGHRTSLSWFVSHELLGNDKARLYDGSTAEWSIDPRLPMEQKIALDRCLDAFGEKLAGAACP